MNISKIQVKNELWGTHDNFFFQRHCLFKEELESVQPCKIWAIEGIKDRRICGQSPKLRELITKIKLMLIAEEKNMMNESVQEIQQIFWNEKNDALSNRDVLAKKFIATTGHKPNSL